MLQVIEEIERRTLGTVSDGKTMTDFIVYADIGKHTGEFFGLTITPISKGKTRRISFHELDYMKRMLENMGA